MRMAWIMTVAVVVFILAIMGMKLALGHPFPRVVGLVLAPLAHQLLQLGVAAFRQHDAYGSEQVALLSVPRGKAPAFEPKRPARTGAGWNRELDGALERWHPDLGAQHRFVERDGKLEPQVCALTHKQRMLCDGHGDQKIADTAAIPWRSLSFEPDLLAVGKACGNLDFHFLPRRQLHPLRHPVRSFIERDVAEGGKIGA